MTSFPEKEFFREMRIIRYLFFGLSILFLLSCNSGKQAQHNNSGPGYLFNGKDLEGWEITNFGTQGPVYVSEGSIILGMGEGCTGITLRKEFPEKDYKVTLDAMRVDGTDFFCGMTFPAGKEPCTLVVGGWGGATIGLSSINGKDASENETTKFMEFNDKQWYNICLLVKDDVIKAWIDSIQVIDFRRDGKRLSIRPEVELSKPFGITSWTTTAAIRNIRVERIGADSLMPHFNN